MLKYLIMWASICSAAPFVCSSEPDSLDIMLDEISVVAKNVISKTDRRIIIPPKGKVDASTSGLDLLQKLALPGISVNQLTGSVTITSGGTLNLYIDGIPATESRIAALDPADIIRIEFHDSPGVRYGDADAVLDYITRRKPSGGGRLSLESMDCVGSGKFAIMDEVAAQLFSGKSSWSFNVGYMQMKRNNWVRDYEEIWRFPDREVVRREQGLPVKAGNAVLNSSVNYQYSPDESNLLNVRVSLDYDDTPYKEEGDRHSLLTTSESADVIEIREHTSEKSLKPSIAVHYRHAFNNAGSLSLNLEGSWLKSSSNHSYSESKETVTLYDLISKTNGSKYGIYAEGVHEITLGNGVLTSGLRYSNSKTSNDYALQSTLLRTDINQSEAAIFADYNVAVANWGLSGGLTGKWLYASQRGDNRMQKYALLPTVGVSYKPNSDLFFRYNARFDRKMPPLAAMSNVSQEIQPGMIRRGNPEVKSFSTISQEFSFSYGNKFINLNLAVNYLDEEKPVMNSVIFDNGVFIQTFRNQQYFRRLRAEAMLAVTPWKEYVTLWVAPEFTRFFSRGTDYNLARNLLRIHFGVDVSYRHIIFTACTMSGAANYMYGDEITTEKPMNMILAGYKGSNWTVQAGVFNLMKTYWMKTENLSPLTPFKSNAHCGKNTYFAVKLSFNLNFGNRRNLREDSPSPSTSSNLDMDAGIINGLK